MTWVVGGNCFNGFICVADIQATIIYPGIKGARYYNCVQKIHRVSNNLCVAFCGDIRSGLEIIQELRWALEGVIKANEYFDIDGQSKSVINFLRESYNRLNPRSRPVVEFMFLWNAQDGEDEHFRPFCMKFRSPNFGMSSTARIGLTRIGSGNDSEGFRAIADFLAGADAVTETSKRIFPNQPEAPNIWTVQKFKKLLFNEATNIDFAGVSKSFISFESVVDYAGIFPEDIHLDFTDAFKKIGVAYDVVHTENHSYNQVTLDPDKIKKTVSELFRLDIRSARDVQKKLQAGLASANLESISKLPTIKVDKIYGDEEIHRYKLVTTWDGMSDFLDGCNIKADACIANA